jgi:hypothetical protein
MTENISLCLACQATQEQTPLIQLVYQNQTFHICPEHLPLLIHSPQKLIGKLPGAEKLKPYESE